jgi:hypothetical protein
MGKLLAVTEKMQNKQGGWEAGRGRGGSKIEKRILRIEKGDERVNIQKKFRENLYIFFFELHLVEFYLSFVLGFVIFSYI